MFTTRIYSQNISEILDKSCLKPVALWPGTFYFLALGKACWRLSHALGRQLLSCLTCAQTEGRSGMDVTFPWGLPSHWHCPERNLVSWLVALVHRHHTSCLAWYFSHDSRMQSLIGTGGLLWLGPVKTQINGEGINLCMSAIEQVHFVICSSELYNPASQSSK